MPKLDIAGNNSLYGIEDSEIEAGSEVTFCVTQMMGGILTPKSDDVEFTFSMQDPAGTYHFVMPNHDVKIDIVSAPAYNPYGFNN